MFLSKNKTEMFETFGKLVKGAWKCCEWMWELICCIAKSIKYIIACLTFLGIGVTWWAGASFAMWLFDYGCYGISGIAWCLHWMFYIIAFLHWLDDPNKMSIVLATSAGWLVLFMLRYHNWLVLFWAWVLVAHDSKEEWSPITFVQACTYWTRASVLFCCVIQLVTMLPFTWKDSTNRVYVVVTTNWY